MNKVWLWIVVASAGVLFWNQLESSEKTATPAAANAVPASENSSSAPKAAVEPELADILQIREAAGSALRGSLLEQFQGKDARADFERALLRLATEEAAKRAASETASVEPAIADKLPELIPPNGASGDAPASFVSALRMTSRLLDDRANDFEDSQRYQDARRLRKLAEQLRREARAADQPMRTSAY